MKSRILASAAALTLATATTQAAFHVMQIEQVIGGVNGDNSAQAIQLRLRVGGQNQVQSASLWAADAAGANRVLLLNIGAPAASGTAGRSILFTTAAFNAGMVQGGNTGFTGDFLLTTPIPSSYLTAGKITFESDGGTVATPGTIWWALAWGGAAYTGTNTGTTQNDGDGIFGPAFGTALPTSGSQGVFFDGAFGDASTNNLADYLLDTTAVVIKNNASSFAVVPEPGSLALLAALGLGAVAIRRRRA